MAVKGWSGAKPMDFIADIEANAVKHVQAIGIDVLQAVIVGSPVDTSAYRSNHRISITTPDLTFDDSARDESGGATLQRGAAVLAGIQSPYGEFHIQNNMPYGDKLEDGGSKQAPDGVYRPAFAAARAKYTGS